MEVAQNNMKNYVTEKCVELRYWKERKGMLGGMIN